MANSLQHIAYSLPRDNLRAYALVINSVKIACFSLNQCMPFHGPKQNILKTKNRRLVAEGRTYCTIRTEYTSTDFEIATS